MKKLIFSLVTAVCASFSGVAAQTVITVSPGEGDMTGAIQEGIEKAKRYRGDSVVINLCNADYHIYRKSASVEVYYASNTTSEAENPDPTKHIGLWLKDMERVTIDGRGARIITHGEMTPFVIDSCRNVTLRNLTVAAADPTVAEMTVLDTDSLGMTVRVHPDSGYRIQGGKLCFTGEGWSFSEGIAQIYDPRQDVVWRSWSPLSGVESVEELRPGVLRLDYGRRPEALSGQVFQMRDAIRDEVGGLIQYSRNVVLENVHLAFLGNFGVLGQMSENLTYRYLTVAPEPGSGRTCAGFADFLHFSGCKGRIVVEHSRFSGSQDDAINVHGTHLAVTGFPASDRMSVRYMHPQTYGFRPFSVGDELELVDAHSLLLSASFRVKEVRMTSPREVLVTLDRPVPSSWREDGEWVVENVTHTPEVVIRHNFFAHIPTRGILVTTRRRVLVEGNTFFRTQMSGVLIADDARSWFESGPVKDVTIRGNRFLECASPVIHIAPENDVDRGCVHGNIRIENNYFRMKDSRDAVRAKSVSRLTVEGNTFVLPDKVPTDELVRTRECGETKIQGNRMAEPL